MTSPKNALITGTSSGSSRGIAVLLNNDEIEQITNTVGTHGFVNRLNFIAGTGNRIPITATSPMLRAA